MSCSMIHHVELGKIQPPYPTWMEIPGDPTGPESETDPGLTHLVWNLMWQTFAQTQLEVSKSKCYNLWKSVSQFGAKFHTMIDVQFPHWLFNILVAGGYPSIFRQTPFMDCCPDAFIWIDETPTLPGYSLEIVTIVDKVLRIPFIN